MGFVSATAIRIKARIREEGVKGIIHGNRGRICHWKLSAKTYGRIVELARGKYRGFNDHHLTEKLIFEGSILEISKRSPFLSWAGKAVHVHVLLDGSVEIYYKTDRIARFDSKTDCTIGLYRKNGKREVSRLWT